MKWCMKKAVRVLSHDLWYLSSWFLGFVDHLRKLSETFLGDSIGSDRWMGFMQSGDWKNVLIIIKDKESLDYEWKDHLAAHDT